MKKLLVYLSEYKKECFLSPLFKMLEASFELFVPICISRMIDKGICGNDFQSIKSGFAILIILGLVGLASAVTAQYFAAKAACGFAANLRHSLFKHIMHLDFAQIDKVGTSTLITRMTSDVNSLQNGVNMFLRLFLRSPFIVFGAVFMSFMIDLKAALCFVVVVILLTIVLYLITKFNIPMLKLAQSGLERVTVITRENLSGVRVIRAFAKEQEEVNRFEKASNRLTGMYISSFRVSSLLNPLTYVIINLGIVALIHTGSLEVATGALTSGEVVALYNYMSQILLELIKFASLIISCNKALASADRVSNIFEIGMDNTECATVKELFINENKDIAVEFDHVSLRYHEGTDDALSDIDFKVRRGETVGIIGGTGCGKTSLVSLVSGFYAPTSGIVKIDGKDIRDISKEALTKNIGVCLQKSVLFKGTIRENLKFGNEAASDEELISALENAVCKEVVQGKGGLDALVEQDGKNFSGGQRQRLSIARTLAMNPKILILDDSSSALDYITDKTLRDNLKRMDENMTVFIVSQRTASIKDADHIIVLEDGEMVGYGRHDELLKTCTVYREISDTER